MRQEIKGLIEISKRMRKYSSFFESLDKEAKEIGVAEELVPFLNAAGLDLRNLRPQRPDPPDCVCDDPNGNLVAIEVAEIVCEDAVRLNAQGHNVYRQWRPGELAPKIDTALREKDEKTFRGGPFAGIIVCLFTDEPALPFDFAAHELFSARFGPYKRIGAAYLLFRHDPGSQTYPVLPLRIAA